VTSVIVDASVIVACAIADGKARRTLLGATEIQFYAPAFVLEEVRLRTPKIIALSGVAPAIVSSLMEDIFAKVAIVPREGSVSHLKEATSLAKRAGAQGDEDYVALALALQAPVWTYDKDFHRIPGVRVVSREQIELGRLEKDSEAKRPASSG
jgi:predicted nucleic acid-binding protein